MPPAGRPAFEFPFAGAPRRPGDPAVLVASSAGVGDLLGWVPARPEINVIVADAWAELQLHV
jgi:UDP-glucose 4-epimerase